MKIKRTAFLALTLVLVSVGATITLMFAIDVYLHHKFSKAAGLNIRGYRGRVLWSKRPDEYRLVVLGGSTVFGYGVVNEESFPYLLEQKLKTKFSFPISVANLGINNNGSYSFLSNLEDYRSLKYDLVVLYEGYNDLGRNRSNTRRESGLFRLTGYYPIFPIVLSEKAMLLKAGTSLEAAYWNKDRVAFTPSLANQAAAGSMSAVAKFGESLERKLRVLAEKKDIPLGSTDVSSCEEWTEYCNNFDHAISFALQGGAKVLIASQPSEGDSHRRQQAALRKMITEKYSRDDRVAYISFEDLIALTDATLSFDRMHLTLKGNTLLADAFVQPVSQLIRGKQHAAE